MTFVLTKIQVWIATAVAVALLVALAATGALLVKEKLAHASTGEKLATERAAWAGEREKAATALADATTEARAKEQALTAAAHQSEELKNAEIATLAARAADLRRRLRNAEASAATARRLPGPPTVTSAGTSTGERDGPEFPGPARFDAVSEAERADTLRAAYADCTRQYNAARGAMQ